MELSEKAKDVVKALFLWGQAEPDKRDFVTRVIAAVVFTDNVEFAGARFTLSKDGEVVVLDSVTTQ